MKNSKYIYIRDYIAGSVGIFNNGERICAMWTIPDAIEKANEIAEREGKQVINRVAF